MKKRRMIMKKKVFAVILAAAAICGSLSPVYAADSELVLYTWEGMFPQEVLDGFEEETGCKIVYSNFDTDETMLEKVSMAKGGDYDVVIADDYILEKIVEEGLATKLDKDKISNWALRFFLYLMISEVYARCVPEFYGLIMVRSEPLAKLRIFVICIWTKSENQQNMWPDIFRMKLQGMSSWKKLMKRENIPRSVLWRIVFTMTVWQSVLCFLQIPKIKR